MKQQIKWISVLTTAVLISSFIGNGIPALAENINVEGTEDSPAKAYLTKEIQTTKGTTVPEETYTFTFEESSEDLVKQAISNLTISFSSTDETVQKDSTDIYSVTKSEELFSNVSWPAAGEYVYIVTETPNTTDNTYVKTETTNGVTTSTTYSKAQYKVTAYVANSSDGGTYMKYVTATKIKDDVGGSINETKVNPSQYSSSESGSGGLCFVNTYLKSITTTPIDPTDIDTPTIPSENSKTLAIVKQVTGDLGDKTSSFPFFVQITKPSLIGNTVFNNVTAEIREKGKTDAVETINFNFKNNIATKTIYLKHGQELVFTNMYVGTKVDVQETDSLNHIQSVTANGFTTKAEEDGTITTSGYVTEGEDVILYKNERISSTPTGIFVDNIPYFVVLGISAIGILCYLLIRHNNRDFD